MNFSANAASLTNEGFETGDLTGWVANNAYSKVVSSEVADDGTVYAPLGKYMAYLISTNVNEYTTLSQDILLNAGQKVKGFAAFLGHELHAI